MGIGHLVEDDDKPQGLYVLEPKAAYRVDFERQPLVHRLAAEQAVELLGRRFGDLHLAGAAAFGQPGERIGGGEQLALGPPRIVERRPHRMDPVEVNRTGIGIVPRLWRKFVAAHALG
jgi:hypothetical protein